MESAYEQLLVDPDRAHLAVLSPTNLGMLVPECFEMIAFPGVASAVVHGFNRVERNLKPVLHSICYVPCPLLGRFRTRFSQALGKTTTDCVHGSVIEFSAFSAGAFTSCRPLFRHTQFDPSLALALLQGHLLYF